MWRRAALGAFLALCACAASPGGTPRPAADAFPPSADGLGLRPGSDLVLSAVMSARSALADPPTRIGPNPAYAARIIGQLEYVAAMINEPRFITIAPIAAPQLAFGRAEARQVLGLRQDASPHEAIGALAGAAAALDRGDRAAARAALAPVSPEPEATLATLASLPGLPRASAALALTERIYDRINSPFFF
ncbi:hypothetical protein [Elioraea rosea]|uniref:hypothetical protein n=1 Tax=Elioraea rosea TaxID=2492390 RepID=UPI001182A258|nr:hypothetical protein [Elioraea rosea]